MKSTDLKSKIKTIETDIANLRERQGNIDQELNEIKKNFVSNMDDPETEKRIQELTSTRELIDEIIEEKEQAIAELEENLSSVEEKETREANFNQCVNLAKKADQAAKKYRKLVEGLDQELVNKLIDIAEAQSEWAATSNQFINILETLEPAVKNRTTDEPAKRQELGKAAKEIVKRIEDEGANTEAALSEIYVNDRYYPRVSKMNARAIKPQTDNYGYWIYEMLKKTKKRLRDQQQESVA